MLNMMHMSSWLSYWMVCMRYCACWTTVDPVYNYQSFQSSGFNRKSTLFVVLSGKMKSSGRKLTDPASGFMEGKIRLLYDKINNSRVFHSRWNVPSTNTAIYLLCSSHCNSQTSTTLLVPSQSSTLITCVFSVNLLGWLLFRDCQLFVYY